MAWTDEDWHNIYEKYYGSTKRKKKKCPVCSSELQTWYENRKKMFRCPSCKVTKMRNGGGWKIIIVGAR